MAYDTADPLQVAILVRDHDAIPQTETKSPQAIRPVDAKHGRRFDVKFVLIFWSYGVKYLELLVAVAMFKLVPFEFRPGVRRCLNGYARGTAVNSGGE